MMSQYAAGGGHYAAANAYLDGLALERQQRGLPGTAIQFGPFADTGMAANHVQLLSTLGLHSLKPSQVR